jgi:hypothetical protein
MCVAAASSLKYHHIIAVGGLFVYLFSYNICYYYIAVCVCVCDVYIR